MFATHSLRRIMPSVLTALVVVPLAFGADPTETPARAPRVWAIVIGIDDYKAPTIPDCVGAKADARALRRWLVSTAGWESGQVLLMVDGARRTHGPAELTIDELEPTRENLEWALTDWLDKRAEREDPILIYVAGQVASLGPTKERSARTLVLPVDASPANYDATAWSLERAIDARAARRENPILLWLDTSPQGRGRALNPPKPGDPDAEHWLNALTRWPNVTAWLAASDRPAPEGANARQPSPFLTALRDHLGTKERPASVLACLAALNRDPTLNAQGFRAVGGVSPDLTLWPKGLARLTPPEPELLLQQGHAREITTIAITPDGGQIITGGMDATVKLWRAADQTLLRALPYHTIGVSGLALSNDGHRLVSADLNGAVWLWDLATQRPSSYRGTSPPHNAGIAQANFLGDGHHFVTLDQDGRVVLWEPAEGDALKPLPIAEGATALACEGDQIAVAGADQRETPWLKLFDSGGKALGKPSQPSAIINFNHLVMFGDRIAYADVDGKVMLIDPLMKPARLIRSLETGVERLAFTKNHLVVASGPMIQLVPLGAEGREQTLSLTSPAEQMIGSDDGRQLAACTVDGQVFAWRLEPEGEPARLPLNRAGGTVAVSLAFGPGGRTLVAGGQDGSIQTWDLPLGEARPEIPPHRGQIADLDVSADGRVLLGVTRELDAFLWDLNAGRSLIAIPGEWTSGQFLPNDAGLVLTDRQGNVAASDQIRPPFRWVALSKPTTADGRPLTGWGFGLIACSADGRLIAAGSRDGPLACVWERASGKRVHTIRIPDSIEPLTAIDFSNDGQSLLTASDAPDSTVRIWDLTADKPNAEPALTLHDGDEAVTTARFDPRDPKRLATGHLDGRVLLWRVGKDGPTPTVLKPKGRGDAVLTLAFTPDGSRLIASGRDKVLSTWKLNAERPRVERLNPPHHEQVNSLVVWPDGQRFASGGDDAEVKIWSLADNQPLGTLVALPDSSDWVAYTPDGQFDSSPGAEQRITWLKGRDVLPLDQFRDRLRVFRLTDELRQGRRPVAVSAFRVATPPPNLAIDRPPSVTNDRALTLSIALDTPNLANLRLYQNDLPIQDAQDLRALDPTHLSAQVQLRKGLNRFYVMGGLGDASSYDGRSNEVSVRFDGEEIPGHLHVLALGVSRYQKNPLAYADSDAKAIAAWLGDHGADIQPGQGSVAVLTNAEVTWPNVERELSRLRREVKPEDTVVLFLAGHADILRTTPRETSFCLLLDSFSFPKGATAPLGLRGVVSAPAAVMPIADTKTSLPYSAIYKYIARLQAQNRLVIIDACRAAAAANDPAVRRIEERFAEKVDDGAHRARTSYLLASRRDELAIEVKDLQHGLLTHVLLWGLGDPKLKLPPNPNPANADFDDNQIVTTQELRRFADETMPVLAAQFAQRENALRAGAARALAPTPGTTLQETGGSAFPLARIPK